MITIILIIILLGLPLIGLIAQGIQYRSNNPNALGEWYFTNNPAVVTGGFFDTAKVWFSQKQMQLTRYDSTQNDGTPTVQGGMLWANSKGEFKRSSLSSVITSAAIISGLGFTPASASDLSNYYLASNPNGYISSVPAQSFASLTGKPTTLSGYGITDATPSNRTITINGNTQDLSANRTWTISSTPTYTFNNNVARTLNSNFTISTTRNAHVSYSINLSVTNPLVAGSSTASAFLEYSIDAGSNWITVSQAVNSSSVALAVTIALTQPNTFNISGMIPANALCRIRTTGTGTNSISYSRGQEVF